MNHGDGVSGNTVFENNDFAGKTLIPFSTHEGSGLGY
ncbi:MAG: hypothetical protein IJI23_07850 [Lachnospiraceae bacterium]|nr:hypothetical protein [Lachnospiraceae bacterium]